jgi:LuxR family maltose regulon positive regulatory protein
MARALQLAQPEEYVRSFWVSDPSLAGLLLETGQRTPALAPYAQRLLSLIEGSETASEAVIRPQETLVDPLSERQLEILRLLERRMTNAEIAQTLVLSPNTVKTHLRHIYEKLGVHDRRQAVSRARELGLL